MSWDAYVDSLKQRGMIHGAICGLDGSWFVASDGSKVRSSLIFSKWACQQQGCQKKKPFDYSLTVNSIDKDDLDIIDGT